MKTPLDFPQKDWSNTSALAMDFIRRMLNRKIKHRLSASEALLHPFLSQFLNNTPKRTLKMSLSPENSKRFLAMTLTQRDVKDSFSSHKMTLNPKYNEEKLFKIRKLEFDPDRIDFFI